MTAPALPPQGDTAWYTHYSWMDGQVRTLAGTDPEVVRDTIGAALVGTGITVTPNDVADTITLAVNYGSAANTAVQGNDARVTADQAAGTASIRTIGTGAVQAAAGSHSHTGLTAASETASGIVELATAAETTTGTSNALAVHPAGLKVELDKKAGVALTQTTQTGTAYTLVLADAGTMVEGNNAAATTFTVPPNSSVAFPVGTTVSVRQYGAGQVTIAAGVGVTLRSRGAALRTAGQYAELTMTQRAANEWVVTGDVTA